MIPISVRMTGWMRYRDETLADFSRGSLIAICGENGAGKSSIFDAITFALYGQHRLGKMQAAQLISEDRDRLSVEFEFEADGQRYLVRRSRGKKQGERDQSLWIADGKGEWAAIPGTEKEDALDLAIARLVRLSHAAFTASFLLQQGEATAFIDADPKPRFEIISSLIGLKEYEALEKAAREATALEKKRIDWIGAQITDAGDIDEADIALLREGVAALIAADRNAADQLSRAKTILLDAQRYTRLTAEIGTLDTRIAAAALLLAEKEQIEKDALLHEKFPQAVGSLVTVQQALADAARAEAIAGQARSDAAAIDIPALEAAHKKAADAMKSAATQLKAAEAAHSAAGTAERQAHNFAQIATALIEGRRQIASFEERIKEIDAQLKKLSVAATKLEQAAAAERESAEAAEAAVESARKTGAAARARADSLKAELTQRKSASREAKCARCGQKIDKAAAKQQIDELTASLAEAQATAASGTAAEQSAMKARIAAKQAADEAQAAIAAHIQQSSTLEGEASGARSSHQRAAVALAEQEARLNGRLKGVPTAATAYEAAHSALGVAGSTLETARGAHGEATASEERMRLALTTGAEGRARLEASAAQHEERAAGERKVATTTAAAWGEIGEQALNDPDGVLAALRSQQAALADAPNRKAALGKAQSDHDGTSGERSAKQAEVDAIPAAHQIDEGLASEAEREATESAARARNEMQSQQQQLASAEARAEQLAILRAEKRGAEVRHKHLRKLTTLLGKKGLQGMLVQGALTTITNHANAFLQRLTGGTLQLTLEREGDALELKAIDLTCMREARSAKALSGSQKFRCAVAIASGIGQYAGAGGMRSIVIDEGFGSLDVEGQRLMVDELKQLAQHMDKVIVVSHLEAFTDPAHFPDRLEVRRTSDGASTIAHA